MTGPLKPRAARRVFLALTVTRWFPAGLVIAVFALWPLERGLTVAQMLSVFALTGLVVLLLELPTSGFADAFGRRPVYLTAAVVNVLACVLVLRADSVATFALATASQGVFRALDSGPLEAWFVDTVHLTDPDAEVAEPLAAHGTVVGVSVAAGALVAGGLVAWAPLSGSALRLPLVGWTAFAVLHLVAVALLMREPRDDVGPGRGRRAAASVRAVPGVIGGAMRLLRENRVLRCLVLVQLSWSVAAVVFEPLRAVRLADLLGGEEAAARLTGPLAAAGAIVLALGSAVAGVASRRVGVAAVAITGRVLNGVGVAVMGLAAGPVGLVAAFLFAYWMHGAAGPMHATLVHREATAANRATVLSADSMVGFAAFALALPLVGVLADSTSLPTAMVVAGAVSVLGALLYAPARRAELAGGSSGGPAPATSAS